MVAWAQKRRIGLKYIQPGKPQQNAYVERFNKTVRYDWLAQHLFDDLEQIQEHATGWMWIYNHQRPNMAIGGITPKMKLAMAAWALLSSLVKNGGITGLSICLHTLLARPKKNQK